MLACEPKGHGFDSQSRAHAWVAGQVPSSRCVRERQRELETDTETHRVRELLLMGGGVPLQRDRAAMPGR